ncbi:MAG TPA: TrkA family potassium uptake protein [Candidatus Limiplasma sp.]|nr:TrkA family potassium uptake protein [Candidatus Limiplasma sp.]
MKGKTKQFMVLGMGLFGSSLAKTLHELGHEVLAVDSDEDLVEAIAPYVTQAVQIDATDEAALQELGVRNFDAVIVSIGKNLRDSILVCVIIKELGVPYLIAKATDEIHAKVLRKIGVDKVVFPERDMGMRVAKSLITPNVLEMMEFSGDYRLIEIILPAKWAGNSIIGIDVRRKYGISILAIQRDGKFIVSPSPDAIFETGDILLVLGQKDDINNISA